MNLVIKIFISLSIALILICCDTPDNRIKKDLDTRFTKFEIVEIKPDSSNVCEAAMSLRSLKLNISMADLDISKVESHYFDVALTEKKAFTTACNSIDSITKNLKENYMKFMELEYSKIEPCYRVKYRLYKEELKIEKEEFYYFRVYDGNKTELLHRPCDWNTYLTEQDCSDLMNRCIKGYGDFLERVMRKI